MCPRNEWDLGHTLFVHKTFTKKLFGGPSRKSDDKEKNKKNKKKKKKNCVKRKGKNVFRKISKEKKKGVSTVLDSLVKPYNLPS